MHRIAPALHHAIGKAQREGGVGIDVLAQHVEPQARNLLGRERRPGRSRPLVCSRAPRARLRQRLRTSAMRGIVRGGGLRRIVPHALAERRDRSPGSSDDDLGGDLPQTCGRRTAPSPRDGPARDIRASSPARTRSRAFPAPDAPAPRPARRRSRRRQCARPRIQASARSSGFAALGAPREPACAHRQQDTEPAAKAHFQHLVGQESLLLRRDHRCDVRERIAILRAQCGIAGQRILEAVFSSATFTAKKDGSTSAPRWPLNTFSEFSMPCSASFTCRASSSPLVAFVEQRAAQLREVFDAPRQEVVALEFELGVGQQALGRARDGPRRRPDRRPSAPPDQASADRRTSPACHRGRAAAAPYRAHSAGS